MSGNGTTENIYEVFADRVKSIKDSLNFIVEIEKHLRELVPVEKLTRDESLELLKVLNSSVIEVFDLLRKFSVQDAVKKIETIELYQRIASLDPEKREKLAALLLDLDSPPKVLEAPV